MRNAAHIALFIDFDGTLTQICRSPARVYLADSVRTLLGECSRNGVMVGIVSGRSLPDLRRRARLSRAWYVGAHGYVLREPGGKALALASEAALAQIRRTLRPLAAELHGMPGILFEPKEATAAVHYRNAAPATRSAAWKAIQRLIESHPQLYLLSGKKVWELLPDWRTTKWTAIRRILNIARSRHPGRRLVFYLGDDSTDERVFEKMTGISVAVGKSHSTAARYFLRSPAEVKDFLERVCEVIR